MFSKLAHSVKNGIANCDISIGRLLLLKVDYSLSKFWVYSVYPRIYFIVKSKFEYK
jgi:hypothetical protein